MASYDVMQYVPNDVAMDAMGMAAPWASSCSVPVRRQALRDAARVDPDAPAARRIGAPRPTSVPGRAEPVPQAHSWPSGS